MTDPIEEYLKIKEPLYKFIENYLDEEMVDEYLRVCLFGNLLMRSAYKLDILPTEFEMTLGLVRLRYFEYFIKTKHEERKDDPEQSDL